MTNWWNIILKKISHWKYLLLWLLILTEKWIDHLWYIWKIWGCKLKRFSTFLLCKVQNGNLKCTMIWEAGNQERMTTLSSIGSLDLSKEKLEKQGMILHRNQHINKNPTNVYFTHRLSFLSTLGSFHFLLFFSNERIPTKVSRCFTE